jgi:hypothetical protein
MADFKRRTLILSSGKQIRLYGSSLAIGPSLEIGEGAAPNIFSFMQQQNEPVTEEVKSAASGEIKNKKDTATVLNPNGLSKEDLMEVADYNIQLWMNLKDSLRKHGANNPKVFISEALR